MRAVALWFLLLLWLLSAAVHAVEDVAGSRDPGDIPRYPRAWIVDYSLQAEVAPRAFVVSRVDRIRRELHVVGMLRPDAAGEAAIYRLPDNTPLERIVEHYRRAIGGKLLFGCSGRDCGRSNDWANQIFQQAILYGPDRNQHYLAVERDGRLVSLYVIERGNQRIYAHLQVLTPSGGAISGESLAAQLARRGWSVIGSLAPRDDGTLPADAASILARLGPELDALTHEAVYVVCHLAGSGAAQALVAAASTCADEVVRLLRSQRAAAAPNLIGFGAGPLLPRPGEPGNRVELVVQRGGSQSPSQAAPQAEGVGR